MKRRVILYLPVKTVNIDIVRISANTDKVVILHVMTFVNEKRKTIYKKILLVLMEKLKCSIWINKIYIMGPQGSY